MTGDFVIPIPSRVYLLRIVLGLSVSFRGGYSDLFPAGSYKIF